MLEKNIKKLFIIVYKRVFNLYYYIVTWFKKHDVNKAVFILYRNNKLEGNLLFIYKEIVKQQPEVKIHFVYTQNKMNLNLFRELNIIGNAKYLILDDYYLPIYLIKPSKQLKVIQLWHAAGAFKKFGYSTIGTRFGPQINYLKLVPVHSNYTHVYVSTKRIIHYYAEAFNMSSKNIFGLGVPRTDLFYSKELRKKALNRIYINHPLLSDKKVINILIAPTYRASGKQTESTSEMVNIILDIADYVKEEIRILFKPHPYMNKNDLVPLKNQSNVVIATMFPINEWMLAADGFITDYSSSIFEFSLLKRPLAHFVPDLIQYKRNRGFYQDIERMSDGIIIKNKEGLLDWLNNRTKGESFDTSRMIKYNFDNTQEVSENIVAHFI